MSGRSASRKEGVFFFKACVLFTHESDLSAGITFEQWKRSDFPLKLNIKYLKCNFRGALPVFRWKKCAVLYVVEVRLKDGKLNVTLGDWTFLVLFLFWVIFRIFVLLLNDTIFFLICSKTWINPSKKQHFKTLSILFHPMCLWNFRLALGTSHWRIAISRFSFVQLVFPCRLGNLDLCTLRALPRNSAPPFSDWINLKIHSYPPKAFCLIRTWISS